MQVLRFGWISRTATSLTYGVWDAFFMKVCACDLLLRVRAWKGYSRRWSMGHSQTPRSTIQKGWSMSSRECWASIQSSDLAVRNCSRLWWFKIKLIPCLVTTETKAHTQMSWSLQFDVPRTSTFSVTNYPSPATKWTPSMLPKACSRKTQRSILFPRSRRSKTKDLMTYPLSKKSLLKLRLATTEASFLETRISLLKQPQLH